ncbi:hypothetical protein ACLI09_04335 [Flavobacterium sp. RHBU_24]|uniref:hypothetical protein n=1 Tax=Flavobacterium sp. RHBU_24 TaxID=3391185 RepID=UPI003984FAE6
MKKIIYFLAVAGLITVVACSDEDKLPSVTYTGCQVCEVEGMGPDFIPEDYEICTALHTFEMDTTPLPDTIDNPVQLTYETVYVDGADTNLSAVEYFTLFCDNAYDPDANNPDVNCVTCDAFTDPSTNTQFPAQEICKGSNGNAFIGNADQGVPFAQYVAAKEVLTDCE